MKEQVIFPEPQDVTILATRNGELTQIPGLEFRAPIVPFETDISVYWNTSSAYFSISHSDDVTVKVQSLCQMDGSRLRAYAMPSERSYSKSGKTYVYWKQHTDNGSGYKPDDDVDNPLIVFAEVMGYKTTETLIFESRYISPKKLYLPEPHGLMVRLETYNPQIAEDDWPW